MEGDGTGLPGSPSICARVSLFFPFTFALHHSLSKISKRMSVLISTETCPSRFDLWLPAFHTAAILNGYNNQIHQQTLEFKPSVKDGRSCAMVDTSCKPVVFHSGLSFNL